ncbi:MAG: hypothetical protein R6U50_06310 [Desulfobacterales bacterium]
MPTEHQNPEPAVQADLKKLAHDFNNLLMALSGNLALAKEMVNQEDPVCRFLVEADKAASKTHELVNRLSELSKRLQQPG